MRIISFLALLVASFLPLQASAKDLPKGEYLLLGEVLPGIQQGVIVPVFVHLKTDKGQMDWNFVTVFVPDKLMCEQYGNCQRPVPALSHKVAWNDDGSVQVMSSDRRTGPGLAIDRAEMDAGLILNPVDILVRQGELTLSDAGGTFVMQRRGKSQKVVDLLPMSLDDLQDTIALVKGFEMSFGDLDQCAVRQIAVILNKTDRTKAEQEVVDAARYSGRVERLQSEASYYALTGVPEAEQAEIDQKRMHGFAMQWALVGARKDLTEAVLDGKTMSDAELMAVAEEFLSKLEPRAGEGYTAIATEVLETRREEMLATVRLTSRFQVLQAKGHELKQSICEEITLMQ